MTFKFVESGPSNVGAFQLSGLPWATSSTCGTTPKLETFPFISKNLMLHVTGTENRSLKFGFSLNGINGTNYISLGYNDSFNCAIRTKEIWLASLGGTTQYQLFAELSTAKAENWGSFSGSADYNADVTTIFMPSGIG